MYEAWLVLLSDTTKVVGKFESPSSQPRGEFRRGGSGSAHDPPHSRQSLLGAVDGEREELKSWYGRKHLYQKWRRKKRMYGERYETIATSTDRTASFAFLCVSRRARRPGRYPDAGGHTDVSASHASRCFEPWPSTNHTQYLPCSAKQHRHSCETRQPAQHEQQHRFSRKSDACTKRGVFVSF